LDLRNPRHPPKLVLSDSRTDPRLCERKMLFIRKSCLIYLTIVIALPDEF